MKILRYAIFLLAAAAILAGNILAQSITNTLGDGGAFKIKYGETDYFLLSQSTGNSSFYRNIELGGQYNSSATVGVITKGGLSFLHNYKDLLSDGSNTFVGLQAGNFTMKPAVASGWEGSANTGVGTFSLCGLTTGYQNSALGSQSLSNNTTGIQNTAVGTQALVTNSTGSSNSAFGQGASTMNSDASSNCAFGVGALYYNVSATGNCAFGLSALNHATGNYNTGVGFFAGSTVTSGSNLTLLGNNAQPSSITATNEITLGNTDLATLRCQVTSITALSDARDKSNIRDLTLGLDFLMKVRPRLFNWDRRDWYADKKSDGSKRQAEPTAGFIAQELDALQMGEGAEYLKLVLKENPEKLEATSGNLFPVLVKAVQDLKKEKDAEIAALKKENDARIAEVRAENNARITELSKANASMMEMFGAQQREIESLKALTARLTALEPASTQALAISPNTHEENSR